MEVNANNECLQNLDGSCLENRTGDSMLSCISKNERLVMIVVIRVSPVMRSLTVAPRSVISVTIPEIWFRALDVTACLETSMSSGLI